MTVPISIKTRLLELHRSGKFSTLPPPRLMELYQLCHDYLQLNSSPSSSLNESEYYQIVELQFYLSLQTGHDIELKLALQQLSDKFDESKSERLIILHSIYIEATEGLNIALEYLKDARAKMNIDLKKIDLMKLKKRAIILHGRISGSKKTYAEDLMKLLDITPLDTSAWFELSRLYYQDGELDKAVYCLQEILLIQPFAYNIMALIGEYYYLKYVQTLTSTNGLGLDKQSRMLNETKSHSVKYFSRSLELCSNYTRSWIGLYKITSQPNFKQNDSVKLDKKLNDMALKNLQKLQLENLVSNEQKTIIKSIVV